MPNKKAIVLLSGGLDSAVTLYFAKKLHFDCHCLAFDYRQRHRREIKSARLLASKARVPFTLERISLPRHGSSLLDTHMRLPHALIRQPEAGERIPSTYVPGRNIIFLSFALSFAEIEKAGAIFIGAHAEDYSGYPDCRKEFFRAFKMVSRTGTKAGVEGRPIEIYTPLLHKTKAQIIRMGKKLGVPFGLTRSCYSAGVKPCGECESCFYRAKGFREAGIEDK